MFFTLRLPQSSSRFSYHTSNLKHFSCIALQVAHTPKDILIPAMPCLCAIIDKSDISRLKHKVQRILFINNRRTPEKLEASLQSWGSGLLKGLCTVQSVQLRCFGNCYDTVSNLRSKMSFAFGGMSGGAPLLP
jgi:hypothetical protein